ncbi:MAG: site-specific integrase, partial [Proteobacteria bacterium]|nr:site-specific integrase [Pseudomonadota bacterium]
MATIEKRDTSDGTTYRVKVRMRGYPATTATFDRITDAKRWASETETRIREGRYFMQAEAKRHTFADLVDRYPAEKLPHSKVRDKREHALYACIWRDRL